MTSKGCHDSGSVDLETPSLEMSPKSPLEALDEALMAASSPIAPPRTKIAASNGTSRSVFSETI